jgi:hypothetical protein
MAHDWPTIRTLRHQLNAVVPLGQAPAGAVQLCVNRSEQTRSWLPCAAPAPLAFASNEAGCDWGLPRMLPSMVPKLAPSRAAAQPDCGLRDGLLKFA